MVPVVLPPKKRPDGVRMPSGAASAALVWITPFVFFVPAMVAVGIVRIFFPWVKRDCEKYLKRLADLLEISLARAVEYRQAGAGEHAPSRPPRQPRAQARPGGTTRPAGKPGARTAGRARQKR